MFSGLKRHVSRVAMVILLGLFLTGCSLINGAEQGRVSSGSQSTAQLPASPDSGMSNMKAAEKAASS